jgi:hypothetical protein
MELIDIILLILVIIEFVIIIFNCISVCICGIIITFLQQFINTIGGFIIGSSTPIGRFVKYIKDKKDDKDIFGGL